jgi:hypothetical protein
MFAASTRSDTVAYRLALLERAGWVTLPADIRPPRASYRTYGPRFPLLKNVRGDTRFVRYEASQDGSHPTQGRHG